MACSAQKEPHRQLEKGSRNWKEWCTVCTWWSPAALWSLTLGGFFWRNHRGINKPLKIFKTNDVATSGATSLQRCLEFHCSVQNTAIGYLAFDMFVQYWVYGKWYGVRHWAQHQTSSIWHCLVSLSSKALLFCWILIGLACVNFTANWHRECGSVPNCYHRSPEYQFQLIPIYEHPHIGMHTELMNYGTEKVIIHSMTSSSRSLYIDD